jgi:hypothetical protein
VPVENEQVMHLYEMHHVMAHLPNKREHVDRIGQAVIYAILISQGIFYDPHSGKSSLKKSGKEEQTPLFFPS